jgi:hypothetical protein
VPVGSDVVVIVTGVATRMVNSFVAGRHGVVHGELARPDGDRCRALAARADGPAAGDWLPEVLIIGQPVQSGPKLMPPVPLKLVDQLGVPVNVHARRK